MARRTEATRKPEDIRLNDLPVKILWAVSGSVVALVAGAFVLGQVIASKLASVSQSESSIKINQLKAEVQSIQDKLKENNEVIRDQQDKEQFISLYTRYLRAERDVLANADPNKKSEIDGARSVAENSIDQWFIDAMHDQRLIWKKSPDSLPTVVFQDGTSWVLPDSVRSLNCGAMLMSLLKARPNQERPEVHGKILLIFP